MRSGNLQKGSAVGFGGSTMRLVVQAWLALGVIALAVVSFAGPADAQRRVALVVGNGAYDSAGALASPPRDAAAIAALLTRVGFEVESLRDLNQSDFVQALR